LSTQKGKRYMGLGSWRRIHETPTLRIMTRNQEVVKHLNQWVPNLQPGLLAEQQKTEGVKGDCNLQDKPPYGKGGKSLNLYFTGPPKGV